MSCSHAAASIRSASAPRTGARPRARAATPLRVILTGITLEHQEDGPLLRLARLALIVAEFGRCGGPRASRSVIPAWSWHGPGHGRLAGTWFSPGRAEGCGGSWPCRSWLLCSLSMPAWTRRRGKGLTCAFRNFGAGWGTVRGRRAEPGLLDLGRSGGAAAHEACGGSLPASRKEPTSSLSSGNAEEGKRSLPVPPAKRAPRSRHDDVRPPPPRAPSRCDRDAGGK